jgi:NADPH2:quinone reductase
MKEGIFHGGPPGEASISIIDSPIPEPEDNQILIKVIYSGSNPKDWKYPEFSKTDANSGDDIAGYVEKVGKGVYEFKKGDRVAAFHRMVTPHGSFAEYAIAPAHTTFHLAENVSLEEVGCRQTSHHQEPLLTLHRALPSLLRP